MVWEFKGGSAADHTQRTAVNCLESCKSAVGEKTETVEIAWKATRQDEAKKRSAVKIPSSDIFVKNSPFKMTHYQNSAAEN